MVLDEINEHTTYAIASFSENSIIDLAQRGMTIVDDGQIKWIKCRFRDSQKTYVFTKENYVKSIGLFMSKFNDAMSEFSTMKKIASDIMSELEKASVETEQRLTESTLTDIERGNMISTSRSLPASISISEVLTVDKDALSKTFDEFYELMRDLEVGGSMPPVTETTFKTAFTENRTDGGESFSPRTMTSIQLDIDGVPVVVYTEHDVVPTNSAEIWKKGLEAICFTGKLCKKTPSTTSDISDIDTALSNFDELTIPPEDDEDDLVDDDDMQVDEPSDKQSEEDDDVPVDSPSPDEK